MRINLNFTTIFEDISVYHLFKYGSKLNLNTLEVAINFNKLCMNMKHTQQMISNLQTS